MWMTKSGCLVIDNRLEQKLEIMIIVGKEKEFMRDYVMDGGDIEVLEEVIVKSFPEKLGMFEKIKLLIG